MATISQPEGPPARSVSPHPGPSFRVGPSTVKPSPAKHAMLANHSPSGSFEGEGSPTARQLLKNVKQDDEQDTDIQQPKRRRHFVKKSPTPSHHTPGSSSTMNRHYNRLGILYPSSPDSGSRFSPSSILRGAPDVSSKFRGLLGVSNTSTLPPSLSTNVRLHEGHSVAATGGGRINVRPASFHSGMHMAVDRRIISSESESVGDVTGRDAGAEPEAVGRGTGAVGHHQSPMEHGSPDVHVRDSISLSSGAIQRNPSPPISLRDSASEVDKPGTTSASSPDSGYGNTPENNLGTANVTDEGGSPAQLQVQTCSEQQLQGQSHSDEAAVESCSTVVHHHEFSPEPHPNQPGLQTGQTSIRISLESEVSPEHITRPPRESMFGMEPLPTRSDSMLSSVESSLDWGGRRAGNIPVLSVDVEDSAAVDLPHRLQKKGLPRAPSVPEYLFAHVNAESSTRSSSPPHPSASHSQAIMPAPKSVQYMQYDPVSREFRLVSGGANSHGGSPKFAAIPTGSPKDDEEEEEDEFSSLGQFRDRAERVQSSREILEKLEAAVAKGRQRSHSQPLIKAAGENN